MVVARLSRFAEDPRMQYDEDQLEREADDDPKDSLAVLYRALQRGSESAVHNTMAVARCMESMVHAASRGDQRALTHWHDTARGIVATVEEGGEQWLVTKKR